MYARVILGKVKLDRQEEAIRVYKEDVAPAAKKQKGFIRMQLLTDPETSKFISITIWDSKEDMVAGESSTYLKEQLNKITPLFVGPLTIQHYLVSDNM